MGFPYLSPLPPWTVDIMKQREDYPMMTSFKNPWVILTSAALVVKGEATDDVEKRRKELENIIGGKQGEGRIEGCIISSNINDTELSYSTGATPVGKDFSGKTIVVPDNTETGRKVSTPIVESVDIDTDGANNTLKTAKVTVRCFTLKQFEMFELFFLKPGMNVLVEYGDATLLQNALFPYKPSSATESINKKKQYDRLKDGKIQNFTPFTDIKQALVPKINNYKLFCEEFSKYYRSDTNAIAEYLTRVENSLGTYDLVAGKVLDYSFSIAADGTYEVTFEVSQGNQVSLAIPHNPKKTVTSTEKRQGNNKQPTPFDQIVELMVADLNLGTSDILKAKLGVPHPDGKKWEDDWFNFLKVNQQQKDTVASDDAYVSLRFILDILVNYLVGTNVDKDFFKLESPSYISGKQTKYILPVTSNKNIISSSDDIIFPTAELPKFIATGEDKNEIAIAKDKQVSGLINGYNFHVSETLQIPNLPEVQNIKVTTGNTKVGNALNIFVKYATVVKAWNSSRTRIEFLERILTVINQNSYGLFTLVFGCPKDKAIATIMCAQGAPTDKNIEENNQIYRFKPTTIKSNVLEFSFNFEMSNLVAGRQIFNSGKLLAEARKGKDPNANTEELALPASAYKAIDNSTMGNADGYYSINNVELLRINANWEAAKKLKGTEPGTTEKKPETSTTEANDVSAVISNKTINFLLTKNTKDLTPLIFRDPEVVSKAIFDKQSEDGFKKPTLSPIDVTLTIDGFSGFTPGQYFRIDGIPEIYNKIGVFQITNTKHNVSKEGWKTTIEASHRITPKK